MGIGFSIFLFVIGAILTFAVDLNASGFNLNTVGIILMVGGLLGLFASVLFWSGFSPGGIVERWPAGTRLSRSAVSTAISLDLPKPLGCLQVLALAR